MRKITKYLTISALALALLSSVIPTTMSGHIEHTADEMIPAIGGHPVGSPCANLLNQINDLQSNYDFWEYYLYNILWPFMCGNENMASYFEGMTDEEIIQLEIDLQEYLLQTEIELMMLWGQYNIVCGGVESLETSSSESGCPCER